MVICIHHALSTRRPLGEKWSRRYFSSYILPIGPSCTMVRHSQSLHAPSLVCSWVSCSLLKLCHNLCSGLLHKSSTISQHLAFRLWGSLRYGRVRLLTLTSHTISLLVSLGVSLEQSDPSFLTPNHSFLQQRQWESSYWRIDWHVAFKASSALPLDQASFRGQSVGLTLLLVVPLGCPTRQGGDRATYAGSPLKFPQTLYCLMWWESTQYPHGSVHLPPLQNCFQAFVVGLNTEGQNLFLLHYLV